MFEGETDERRNADPIDDVSLLEPGEGSAQFVFVNSHCKEQKIIRKLTPDHRRDLRQFAALLNAIEPLHQRIMQCLRNTEHWWLCSSHKISRPRSTFYRRS